MRLVPVRVDDDGIDVACGVARAPDAGFAVVTPCHQAPLGITMSHSRRVALLDWAARVKAWVIEDDYVGEFRSHGRPVPALAGLDREGRTLYVGSFSKVVMPALRLGYVVVPRAQVATFNQIATYLAPAPAIFPQMTLASFIRDGHFARHIRRMRRLYVERRAALVLSLGRAFGAKVRVDLKASGMHLLAYFDTQETDLALAARAAAAGLGPAPLTPWSIEEQMPPALILSFTNIPAARAAVEADRLQRTLWP
jgi:GntR family transcriptional regulator/MocR family aminotransferase